MGYKTNSALSGVVLLALFLFQRLRHRKAVIRSHGCEQAVMHQPKEPLSGFDFQLNMYTDVPYLHTLHKRYGNTYQVNSWASLPAVCTIATENVRAINNSKDFGVAPMRLTGMGYFCGPGFITTDGDVWRHARKLLKPSFELTNIRNLETLGGEVDALLEKLPKDGATVDMQARLYAMSPGAPLSADEFVKSFHEALVYSMFRMMLGRAWHLLPQKKYIDTCAKAHGFVDHYIKQALADSNEQKSSRSLIQSLSAQTDDPDFIRSQVIQAMIAAQDTTSELLTNALFLLARHPKYWEQLRAEFVGQPEDALTAENLLSSKLMENILRETLRLYPIFPILGRIALRDTKLPVGGGAHHDRPLFIPEGTFVVMGHYALHRDPEVFGEDAEAFRPERWDAIKPAQWEYQGFGGGHRACLGQQKATIEASYVLARLARAIDKLESRDSRDWKGELKITCKSANGCKVAVHLA